MFRGHSGLGFFDNEFSHIFHLQCLELEKRTRQVEQRNHRLVANANLAAKGVCCDGYLQALATSMAVGAAYKQLQSWVERLRHFLQQ